MADRRGVILAVAGLTAGFLTILAITGPPVELETTGTLRRAGGVCLQLERWTMLGWRTIGQTHSVDDMQGSVWRAPHNDPPCADVEQRDYLVRVFAQPPGIYRLCGLADERACVRFKRVEP